MLKFLLIFLVVPNLLTASVYAINIGLYNKKESAEKVLEHIKGLNGIDVEKLTIFPRPSDEKSFLLRSQNYASIKDAKEQQKIIQLYVAEAFIVERKDFIEESPKLENRVEKNDVVLSERKTESAKLKTNIDQNDIAIYNEALSFFEKRDYKKSFELLSQIYLRHLTNENINFYLARSAFEIESYDFALSAYERILIAQPNNLRAKLEAARTLFHLKSYKSAKKEFNEIAKLNLPDSVRINVERYRGLLEKLTQKKSLNGMVMAGLAYDSNANNGALENSYYLPLINDVLPSAAQRSDTAHQEVAVLNYIRGINDNFSLKNSAMAFAKTMTQQSDKNVVLLGWTPSLLYSRKNFGAEFGVGYNTMWFGSDSYLTTYMINPKLNYKIDDTLSLSTAYRWQRKKNELIANKQRDSKVKGIMVGFNKKLPYGLGLNGAYTIDRERRIRGERTDVDQNIYLVSLALTKEWSDTLSFNLGYNYRNPKYKVIDRSFFTKREDKNKTYSFGFAKKLQKSLIINGKYSYVKNLSNHAPFSYEKDMVGFNVIKLFM